jgi:alkylhydroperoxidase family enzyme
MRTERMPDPVTLVPGAAEALGALGDALAGAGVDGRLLALCRLRASQLNGCAAGVERAARQVTAPEQVAVWRDTRWFSDEERAALALTEAVTGAEVPDRVWDAAATHFDQPELAALLLAVAITNAENRLDTSTRRQAGR